MIVLDVHSRFSSPTPLIVLAAWSERTVKGAQACHTAAGWQGGLLVRARAGREGQTVESVYMGLGFRV